MRTIQVTPPKKLNECKYLFTRRFYNIDPLKILESKNVTMTSDGICFQNLEIIKDSVQSYPDKIRIFELSGRLQLKTRPTIHLNNENKYLLIFHPWINYYHWLTESIPRIWLVRDISHNLVLLLPESYKKLRYVQESIIPFKFEKVEYFPDGNNIKLKNALIPQIKPVCSDYYPDVVCDLRKFYVEFSKINSMNTVPKNDKIYIIRGNSPRRRITNENDVIDVLNKFDFCPVDSTSLSLFDQILISDQACFMISNGSGLTNMHFMGSGTSVMELCKRLTNLNDFHDRVLWHLASVLKINYYYFFCDPINRLDDMYYANLKINISKFEKAVRKFIEI